MAAEPSEFAKKAAEMTARLKGLRALQEEIVDSVRQVQAVVMFGDHPELTALDDELDIMYRGQL